MKAFFYPSVRMPYASFHLAMVGMTAIFAQPIFAGSPVAQQAYLKASNPDIADYFGSSVSIAGDVAVVGAPSEWGADTGVNGNQTSNGKPRSGAAYIFVRNGLNWVQEAYLKASNTKSEDGFGEAVAVSGTTVVVGCPGEDSPSVGINGAQTGVGATRSGAVYVFVKQGGDWVQQAFIKASNTEEFDGFGSTVALEGDTLVVGAFSEDSASSTINGNATDNSAAGAGAAYVYVRNGSTWSLQAYLKASNCGSGDGFGSAVALSQDTILVGASQEASNAKGVNGNQADNSVSGAGAVYVFTRSGTSWSQQAYLKASNPNITDYFGSAVAISGGTAVIGAYHEDSNATGVNGNQTSNSIQDSGAAYVFVRTGSTWSQQAYLKASNPGPGDNFGLAVAVNGDAVVVGAWRESSNARGIGGNQSNNDANDAGAAYLFSRSGNVWKTGPYLKASNTLVTDTFGDSFGRALAFSGGTILVGAFEEDGGSSGVNGNEFDRSLSSSGAVYVFTGIGVTAPEIVVEQPVGTGLTSGGPALAFGSGAVGGPEPLLMMVIRNTGNAPLMGIDFAIDGPNAADFAVNTSGIGTSLAPDGSATVNLTFTASGIGPRAATLRITSNDADENPFQVDLSGNGMASVAFQDALKLVKEEAGTVQIPIVRLGSTSGAASVRVDSHLGTAGAEDYNVVISALVSFVDGQATATLPVTFLTDALAEANEQFTLSLHSPLGGVGLGYQSTMTVRIVDTVDSTKPTVTVKSPATGANFAEGTPVTVTGTAADNKGVAQVLVSLNGAALIDAFATVSANGLSASYAFGPVALVPGPNTIAVQSVDTRGNESAIVTHTINSIVLRPLLVRVMGTGTVSPTVTVSGVKVGLPYILTAKPGAGQVFNGWTASSTTNTTLSAVALEMPKITFLPQPGLVLTANFIANPFTSIPNVIGTYNGIVTPTGGTPTSNETVGLLYNAKVMSNGTFTSTLKIDGLSKPVNGLFYNDGTSRFGPTRTHSLAITRAGKPNLDVTLVLDMTATTHQITGSVNQNVSGVLKTSSVSADRANYSAAAPVPTALAGTKTMPYTLVLASKAQIPLLDTQYYPQGDGYATMTVNVNGTVTINGKLADHTPIIASAPLSSANTWPIFARLYGLKGCFAGMATLTDANATTEDVTGTNLRWVRPFQPVQWYPDGWADGITVDAHGARYVVPLATSATSVFPLTTVSDADGNASLTFTSGLLSTSPLGFALNISTADVATTVPLALYPTLVITKASGVITGKLPHSDGTFPTYQGVILQKGANAGGHGYFMTQTPKPLNYLGESGNVEVLAK